MQGHINQSLDDVTHDQPPLTIQYKVCPLEIAQNANLTIKSIRITFGWYMLQFEPMHATKLMHIASGATAYGSASRASVEKIEGC